MSAWPKPNGCGCSWITTARWPTSPTPDHVNSDPELTGLLTRLARHPRIRIAVISGRRLSHVEVLVPVPGIFLAGTYGIELRTSEGERTNRVEYDTVRPTLDVLKPHWEQMIADREGFFLEDKGWALALHARFADEDEAEEVLAAARNMATAIAHSGPFRLLGGHKFLEIGPALAHKGGRRWATCWTVILILVLYLSTWAMTIKMKKRLA